MDVSRCNSYRFFVGAQSLFSGKMIGFKSDSKACRAPIEARR
ncbi:hypothetical protein LEP1GSC173_0640 [Leptospira interrogans str. HAI1594]|nr:hypothetical protein LEP1GSC014_1090 [Leptospira interrogans serovar Pomona str. Pomona]EKP77190.1 hypothetical protein LEP1GSC173_0640 [Leptospira interrogans str. HAI1594]EMN55242.1 hypothetical protein LEP1GSC089_3025 [Leptospira interrogans serovar Autumnalis str. LP101]EMO20307.1 hypothetical protein LEP1GSC167_2859 [Leptospira interrogans serovar Copenhageni str. HAI0188]EMO35868.1 hypothetical protein LEP1GSC177_1269 [Leptospira interrogans str. MMD3731]EMY53259.1 hypothetical protei